MAFCMWSGFDGDEANQQSAPCATATGSGGNSSAREDARYGASDGVAMDPVLIAIAVISFGAGIAAGAVLRTRHRRRRERHVWKGWASF